MLRNRRFSLVAGLTLALGIAVSTTVFTWIEGLLLDPFPGVSNGSELVMIETQTPSGEFLNTSYRDYRDYRDNLKLVSGLAGSLMNAFNLGDGDHLERVWGEYVSGNYFSVLGVEAATGRVFSPEERGDKPGAFPVAVISDRLWRKMFDANPQVVGSSIKVNRHELTIIGVAPPEFRGTVSGIVLEIWVPMVMAPQLNGQADGLLNERSARHLAIIGRLEPGVSRAQAGAEVASAAQRIAEAEPRTNAGFSAALLPVWNAHSGAQGVLLKPLQILMAGSLVVFLIVSANVANLQLARATTRQKEFSIRLALGSGGGRLARQLLTESLLLAAAGACAGIPLALWMTDSLTWLLPPLDIPVGLGTPLNRNVVAFTVLLSIAGALITGIAPAIHARRANLSNNLKDSGRGTTSGGGLARIRGVLVIAEVALALFALVGTGLFLRSFDNLRAINPGFNARNVLLAQFQVATFCRTPEDRMQFGARLHERLKATPGITAVSYSNVIPLDTGPSPWWKAEIEGYVPGPSEDLRISGAPVSSEYFETLDIPLLEGRAFTEQDTRETAPVIIVNQAFARRYFDGRSPVGRKVKLQARSFTVIGLARDSKYNLLTEAPRPFLYTAFRQMNHNEFWIAFFVRTAGPPRDWVGAIRREAGAADPNAGVAKVQMMGEYLTMALYQQKVAAILLGVLGAVSVLLAAVGLYSVMSYAVSRRTTEFGVRMALGARTGDVLRLVVRQGAVLTLVGLLVGSVIALAASRLAGSLLVNVKPADPVIFATAALLLGAVAMAASYLPALRATKVDPIVALRCE